MLERFLDRLTDNFNKTKGGNTYKNAQLSVMSHQEQEDVLTTIDNWHDVDQAEGTTLDMHGKDVQQDRGQSSDEVYRVLIKSKVLRLLSDGSIDVVIDFLAFILDADPTEVRVRELWPEGKTATLELTAPVEKIGRTGLNARQFGTLLNMVVAGGVRAEGMFQGTFRFSNQLGVVEKSPQGFAPVDMSSGGSLGVVYNPETDFELPI